MISAQKVEDINIKLSEKVLPTFHGFWRVRHKYLFKVLKGGRNSAKSTTISEAIIIDLMKFPVNALVLRKVANTLSESVFEQLLWAINHLEVSRFWKIGKSPLSLTYTPRGNKIIFRGADEPQKIKSIKTSRFPITILWVEELAEFKNEEEVDIILNSILRAELPENLKYSIFFSYNPPKRKQNWVNKKYNTQFIQSNTYVHHSTYLDNPYVSEEFKTEAEEVKKKNELKYRWIFLGEPIGGGIVPFSNLVFRKITDQEIATFDNIRQGADWGYADAPFAMVRLHYDKTRRKIFFIKEIYGLKLSNRVVAEKMKEKRLNDTVVVADSEEPKSIDDLNTYGVRCIPAKKGPGSVEFGEKWLDDLTEIVIDAERTPNVAREFENIDYAQDKDGNIKDRLEDKDNHTIDATRYAMENDMISYKTNTQTAKLTGAPELPKWAI